MPFLSVGGNLGWREEVSRGVSELSGEYLVENVRGEDGEVYRRLIFLSNPVIVQSESRLVSSNTGQLFFHDRLAIFFCFFTVFLALSNLTLMFAKVSCGFLVVLSREGIKCFILSQESALYIQLIIFPISSIKISFIC